jgi:hypothetical protein
MSILYSGGKREINSLMLLPKKNDVDVTVAYEVAILPKYYSITINGSNFLLKRTSSWCFIRAVLQPYFGGTTVAPKDFRFNFS